MGGLDPAAGRRASRGGFRALVRGRWVGARPLPRELRRANATTRRYRDRRATNVIRRKLPSPCPVSSGMSPATAGSGRVPRRKTTRSCTRFGAATREPGVTVWTFFANRTMGIAGSAGETQRSQCPTTKSFVRARAASPTGSRKSFCCSRRAIPGIRTKTTFGGSRRIWRRRTERDLPNGCIGCAPNTGGCQG
jgi:hypothetical protein